MIAALALSLVALPKIAPPPKPAEPDGQADGHADHRCRRGGDGGDLEREPDDVHQLGIAVEDQRHRRPELLPEQMHGQLGRKRSEIPPERCWSSVRDPISVTNRMTSMMAIAHSYELLAE